MIAEMGLCARSLRHLHSLTGYVTETSSAPTATMLTGRKHCDATGSYPVDRQ
jgi:hypothetical protein